MDEYAGFCVAEWEHPGHVRADEVALYDRSGREDVDVYPVTAVAGDDIARAGFGSTDSGVLFFGQEHAIVGSDCEAAVSKWLVSGAIRADEVALDGVIVTAEHTYTEKDIA